MLQAYNIIENTNSNRLKLKKSNDRMILICIYETVTMILHSLLTELFILTAHALTPNVTTLPHFQA